MLQYLPIFLSAIAGIIGLLSKRKISDFRIFEYLLSGIIIVSTIIGTVLIYQKRQSDQTAKDLAAATNIQVGKPFSRINLIFDIDNGSNFEKGWNAGEFYIRKNPLVDYLFEPSISDGKLAGKFETDGLGLKANDIEFIHCNGTIYARDFVGDENKGYYLSEYAEYETDNAEKCPILQSTEEFYKSRETASWGYDNIAGATSHGVDVNNSRLAGRIMSRTHS